MKLAEQAGGGGGALYWQEAIDQFTDILVIFNPRDELAKELKLHCVRKRDDSFGETMKSEFRRFTQLVERGERSKGFEVLDELIRVVIEHAVDIQQQIPAQTVRIAREFIAMVDDYSRRSVTDLSSALASVFARLHCLAMWAHLISGDPGAAEIALDHAMKAAPQETLPWLSKAELLFALDRHDEVGPALYRAEAYVRSQHDRYLMGATHHILGNYDEALEWIKKVDVEKFKAESYRPDRSERILSRLKSEIEEEKEMGSGRTPKELESGELADLIKRMLSGGEQVSERPSA